MTKQPEMWDLLKRAAQLRGGLTASDFRNFRILFARRGDAPRQHRTLESSISFREFKESLLLSGPLKSPENMRGDIILGRNPGGQTRYESRYAPNHLLGVGTTGVGKTVMLVFLVLQYLFIASGIWIFDFIKRELRGVKRLAEKAGFQFDVCRYEYMRINLLDPQGLNPAQYANVCAEFLTITLSMPPVAKLILKICITELYQKCGILINPDALPPTLKELIQQVRAFEGNKAAKEAILIRLRGLLANQGHIFNVRKGLPITQLARRFIVWECDGTEAVYQNLVVSYLISILFMQRVQQRDNDLMIVALDEAARIYSKRAESTYEGPSYISTMTSTIRKMMIGLMVFTQTTYDLANSIVANSGIKILFPVGTAQDYEVFGRSTGMTKHEIQWAKTNLKIGSQIIKMGFGWRQPFLNRTPNITLPEDVSDHEVCQSSKAIMNLVQEQEPVKQRLLLSESSSEPSEYNPVERCSSAEKSLYDEICRSPEEPNVTKHYIQAGLTTNQGTRAKKSLVKKGLVKEISVETGKRGGAKSFLEVVERPGRRGTALHNYLRKKSQAWYGFHKCSTQEESPIELNGQVIYVDLAVVWPDGKTEALEIETEDSPRALENVRKNLKLGFAIVSVLTPNKKVRKKVKNRLVGNLEKELHKRIRFVSISFYDL